MRETYLRLCGGLAAAVEFAVITLMVAITLVVLTGVVFRYVVQYGLPWTEESSRYMMVWMAYLGAGLVTREGGHVAIDYLQLKLPARARSATILVCRVLMIVFLLSVVGASIVLLRAISSQVTPTLRISMMWPYLAVPMGCLLMTLETLTLMLRDLQGQGAHAGPRNDMAHGSES